MGSRLDLHTELLTFLPTVYFQPPSDIRMTFPCIIYRKTIKNRRHANNRIYNNTQEYELTLVERSPDSDLADRIEAHFQHATIGTSFVLDNLNHTTIKLYF